LEDKNQDSDGSIIIPEELEEMLVASLKGDKSGLNKMPDEELLSQIDNISLSKKEVNAININYRWVDDLLTHEAGGSVPKTFSASRLTTFAKGPLLITEKDICRVNTPQKERYDRVKNFSS